MPKINLFENENNLSFPYVATKRINYLDYTNESLHNFINQYCIEQGKPLVVFNMNKSIHWNDSLFTLDQLKDYRGDMEIELKTTSPKDKTLKTRLGDFIQSIQETYKLPSCTSNSTIIYKSVPKVYSQAYAKDVICPTEYRSAIEQIIPSYLLPHGSHDLFSSLPSRFQAEHIMCYLGQDKTGTPLHRDLCGTMGHNLMTMASSSPDGYAEWFIIENKYRHALAEVLKPTVFENKRTDRTDRICKTNPSKRKRKRSREQPCASSSTRSSFMESDRAWLTHYLIKKAQAVVVNVIVQRPGDLVIIPSRAYHQVRNAGVSVKIAWNRITPQTLTYAFEDQLPLYRIINRPEVYKCKAIVAITLKKWNKQLEKFIKHQSSLFQHSSLIEIKLLLHLLLHHLIEPELLYPAATTATTAATAATAAITASAADLPTDPPEDTLTIVCDFCHGDIFHRYYHCERCDDHYDLCMDCYALGRACEHVNDMRMRQSADDMYQYVKLYQDLVKNVNTLHPETIKVGLEDDILSKSSDTANNLATTCRRLELHRRDAGTRYNYLKCSHCNKSVHISTLGQQGISLSSIFRRGPCRSFNNSHSSMKNVFVCNTCTNRCHECWPLEKKLGSLEDFDLVYYHHPAHDSRNRGGFIDYTIERTCDQRVAASQLKKRKKKKKEKPSMFKIIE
ncbi:uncharacterized protein BX663DRAFT_558330 [Cokeromyces recurvatus]|uniref:uncharacterized protein n=1 Tax=Cokeromyces recurvatus TaxID=90255 RepID=UPI002220C831|nr:uncharacterized protein BX663DRAFT_558330 [Cokeromyces recurvatus]KAI7906707.1 hypothetical protein BX663DRAFT_558330 [Cokeromyces recurvatus]